jgi:hypothetical protein
MIDRSLAHLGLSKSDCRTISLVMSHEMTGQVSSGSLCRSLPARPESHVYGWPVMALKGHSGRSQRVAVAGGTAVGGQREHIG